MRSLCVILCLLNCLFAEAQSHGRALFGSNASCAHSGINALLANPAGVTCLNDDVCMINYSNSYAIPELWKCNMGYAFDLNNSAIPVSFSVSGPKYCLAFNANVGFGIKVARNFNVGAALNAVCRNVNNGYMDFAVGTTIGSQFFVNDKTIVGIMIDLSECFSVNHSFNFSNVSLDTAVSYFFLPDCGITLEVSKCTFLPLEIKGFFELKLVDNLFLVSGYNSGNNELFCSFTLCLNNINVMFAASCNFMLGVSPEILVVR